MYRFLRFSLAGLLLVAFAITACDSSPVGSDAPTQESPSQTSDAAFDVAPMKIGERLLPPDRRSEDGPAIWGYSTTDEQSSPENASAYGCYLSSRPYRSDVFFRSVYLHFPESVVAEAGGAVDSLVYKLRAPHPATPDTLTARFAHCIIPATPEAHDLTIEALLKPGAGAAAKDLQDDVATAPTEQMTDGGPVEQSNTCQIDYEAIICVGNQCWLDSVTFVCPTGGPSGETGPGDWWGPAPDPTDGYGGGGDIDTGGPGAGGTCTEILPEPGSGCVPAEPISPCESDNPPDYCDEAGSCHGQDLSAEDSEAAQNDEEIVRGLEDSGALNELWANSNADAEDQSARREQGGWVVADDDGSYHVVPFDEVENDIVYTPIRIRGISSGARPANTIAVIHTHPFAQGEIFTDVDVVRQYITVISDENPAAFPIHEIADPYAGDVIRYTSEPSPEDREASANLHLRGYILDEDHLIGYSTWDENGDGVVQDGEGSVDLNSRCGY